MANMGVDVNTVVDVLRDTKALYSIINRNIEKLGIELLELKLKLEVDPQWFAELFYDILDEVRHEIKLIKLENTKIGSIELKERIYGRLLEKRGYRDSELTRLMVYSAVDFVRAKSNYYRSPKTKVYIVDVSRGSIIVTIVAMSPIILCIAGMTIAYLSQRDGKDVRAYCDLRKLIFDLEIKN